MIDLSLVALAMGVGVGLVVALAGLTGRAIFGRGASGRRLPLPTDRLILRIALGVGGAVLVLMGTRWVVAAVVVGVIGFSIPGVAAARQRHAREINHIEAIASWTEQLRDTLAAANGLEHAVAASARVAPSAIAPAVDRLAARIEYESLSEALLHFADDLDHPLADFVVAALRIAAEREARDLGPLLGHLADCARDEAKMRTRVWVGRARSRTAVKSIAAVIPLFVGGVYLLDPEYLSPYNGFGGQLALACIALLFAVALGLMEKMGRITMPDRFTGRKLEVAA